jgi:hypothetical protein
VEGLAPALNRLMLANLIVGSPTQRRQPAPSVTSERGTVLVNFVGFGNRFLFILQKWAEGR